MKKGVALLWVLILSIVFLTLSGTMVTYMVKEAQSTIKIQESTRAYAGAKTGLEWALKYLSVPGQQSAITIVAPKSKTILLDDIEVSVYIKRLSDSPRSFSIESTGIVKKGTAGEVRRKIEQKTMNPQFSYIYTGNGFENPNNFSLREYVPGVPPTITDITNTGSFTFVYDFWGKGGEIGLRDSSGNSKIYVKYGIDGYLTLYAKMNGTDLTAVKSKVAYTGFDADSNSLKGQISYLKDNAITFTVLQNQGTDRGCKEVLTIPIDNSVGPDINFDWFYASFGAVFDTNVGYPSSISAGGTHATYFMFKK